MLGLVHRGVGALAQRFGAAGAAREMTLQDIAGHPVVTYTFGFTGRSKLDQAFAARGTGAGPRVKAWLARVQARPAYRRALAAGGPYAYA